MKYPEDRIIKVDEGRELLEQEFRERILKKYPNINANRFMDLVEAFLRGYDKACALCFNIYHPDFKLAVFDDDI